MPVNWNAYLAGTKLQNSQLIIVWEAELSCIWTDFIPPAGLVLEAYALHCMLTFQMHIVEFEAFSDTNMLFICTDFLRLGI